MANDKENNVAIVLSEALLAEAKELLRKETPFGSDGFIRVPSESGTVAAVIAADSARMIALATITHAGKEYFLGIPLDEDVA